MRPPPSLWVKLISVIVLIKKKKKKKYAKGNGDCREVNGLWIYSHAGEMLRR